MSESKATNKILTGQVAQIISARELVINIGGDQGVEKGMKFAVLAATPLEIRDPTTSELLDTIDREKVRVEATSIRPKIAICRTYRTKQIPGGPLYVGRGSSGVGLDIASLMSPPREIVETLKASDHSQPEPLSEQESYVKIGDRVVLVEE